jgi:hypothetical protein
MAAQTVPFEFPLIWDIVVVVIVLHLGAFVRRPTLCFVSWPGPPKSVALCC